MTLEPGTPGVIPPQQLAHVRAQLYARRAVTNQDAAMLLEAYDELVRRLEAMTAVAGSGACPRMSTA
jgi:hypothetical protein